MPMQPVATLRIEGGGLTLGLSEAQVNEQVKKRKLLLPNAIGMNNHMGSAIQPIPRVTYLMTRTSRAAFILLDSRTIGESVAGKIAKEQGVRVLDRHVFLDDSDNLTRCSTPISKCNSICA